MNSWDSPGKGRKVCKSCGVYVGVRALVCVCGAKFLSKEKAKKLLSMLEPELKKPKESVKSTSSVPKGHYIILTPAGAPPVELKNTSRKSVFTWIEKVQSETHDILSGEALAYWANVSLKLPVNDPREKELVAHIDAYVELNNIPS